MNEHETTSQRDKIYHAPFKGDWRFLTSLAHSYKSTQHIIQHTDS